MGKQSLGEIYEMILPDLSNTNLKTADVVAMNSIPANKVLPREDVMPGILFNLIASGQDDVSCFMLPNYCMLEAEGYNGILREQYGEMNFSHVCEAFVDYLGERRKEEPRYLEIWKLNRKR